MKKLILFCACAAVMFTFTDCNKSKKTSPGNRAMAYQESINNGKYESFADYIYYDSNLPAETVSRQKAENGRFIRENLHQNIMANGGIRNTKVVNERIMSDGKTAQVTLRNTYNNGRTEDVMYNMVMAENDWKVRVGNDRTVWTAVAADGTRTTLKLMDGENKQFAKLNVDGEEDMIKTKETENKDVVKIQEGDNRTVVKDKQTASGEVIKVKENGQRKVYRESAGDNMSQARREAAQAESSAAKKAGAAVAAAGVATTGAVVAANTTSNQTNSGSTMPNMMNSNIEAAKTSSSASSTLNNMVQPTTDEVVAVDEMKAADKYAYNDGGVTSAVIESQPMVKDRRELTFYDAALDRNIVKNIAILEVSRVMDDPNKDILTERSNSYKDLVRFKDLYDNKNGFVKELNGKNRDVVKVKENGERNIIKVKDLKNKEVVKTIKAGEREVVRIPKNQ